MGLDMYTFTLDERPNGDTDFEISENTKPERLHYWRKHPNLHGWMQALYLRKGGRNPEFNCATLILDNADIDALEEAVLNNRLPETTGFFFGRSRPEDRDDDLEFIAKARAALAEGKTVIYDSWW